MSTLRMNWRGVKYVRKHKGLVTDIKGKKAIVMTKKGEFLKVNLPPETDIGSEIEFSTRLNFLPLVAGIIIIFLIGSTLMYTANPAVAAYITLDVNSGLELALDKDLNVISVKSTDEAGEEFVTNLKVKGMQVKDAVDLIMDEAVNQNLLNKVHRENPEIVIATVTSNNSKVSLKEEEVGKWVSANLHKHELISEVMVQKASKEDWNKAKKQNISPAKYIIIKKIEEDGIMVAQTQEELLKINVRDLIILMNEKKVKSDNKVKKDKELVMDQSDEDAKDKLDVEHQGPINDSIIPNKEYRENNGNKVQNGPTNKSQNPNEPLTLDQDEMDSRKDSNILNSRKRFDNNKDIVDLSNFIKEKMVI